MKFLKHGDSCPIAAVQIVSREITLFSLQIETSLKPLDTVQMVLSDITLFPPAVTRIE